MPFISRYRTEIILFFLAFAVHAVFVGAIQYASGAHGFISYSDAEYFYYRLALNLLGHGAFSLEHQAPYFPDAYHTPLYPFFVAGLLAIGLPLWGVVLVQGALASATVVLIYLLARALTTSHRLALGAAILALFEPMALYWSGMLLTDTLFTFLFMLAVYALMRRRFFLLGMMLGLAALTRPVMLYLSPFFFLMGAYLSYAPTRRLRDTLRGPLVALSLMCIIIFPWFLHNKSVSGTWMFSGAGWYDLYMHPLPVFAEAYGLKVPQLGIPPDFEDVTQYRFKYVPLYRDAFVSLVREHPLGYVFVHAKKALSSVVSNRYDYFFNVMVRSEMPSLYAVLTPVGIGFFFALGAVFWIGIYALVAIAALNKETRAWWLFTVMIAGANFAMGGAMVYDGGAMSRYLLYVNPLMFIFAIVGVQALLRLRKTLA